MVPAVGTQKGALRASDQAVRRHALHCLRRVLNAVRANDDSRRWGEAAVVTIPTCSKADSTVRALRAIAIACATACAIAIASPALAQTGAEYPNTMPGPAGVPAAGAGSVVPPAPSGSGTMRTYENPASDETAPPPTGSAPAKTHHQGVGHH